MNWKLFLNDSIIRGLVQLVRRPVYYIVMMVLPIATALFMLELMKGGAVEQVPVGIVDRDNSQVSRTLHHNLDAFQQVNIKAEYPTFHEAMSAVQRGDIYGFILLPERLQEKTLSGQQPKISYYINYAYFAPASLQYKGFKTVSMLGNAAIAKGTIEAVGLLNSHSVASLLQPILTHVHGIGNPYTNYSYYLNVSFIPGLLSLFIMLMTAFSIGTELKYGTCRQWIASAGRSMWFAILGKLVPHTVIFTSVGWFIQFLMYRVYGLPLNCPPWHMLIAMPMLVIANQGFALFLMCVAPNFRLGTTLCTLLGVLSFSYCGFSLPSESIYSWVAAIGSIMPVKYYFLISVDQALNGIDLFYSRHFYANLLVYPLLPLPLLTRLKNACLHPIYVP
ncbi:MAG: ABC transporter permease [Bacteroidales bacterium]|nr:ABC transporter permease [Candidatus Sodaliphilus aphodohippi]